MSHVKISYSIEADAKNWLRIWNKNESTHGISQQNIIDFIPNKLQLALRNKTEKKQLTLIKDYLKEQKTFISFLKAEAEALQTVWNRYEPVFFKALIKVTQKPLFATQISAQLTTASLSPYDEKSCWFMVSGYHPLGTQITSIGHELLHLQFIHSYKKFCIDSGLSPMQFEDLKEALTVLLNEKEFNKIIVSPDRGYAKHAILRENICNVWRKKMSFEEFLKKSISLTKKETLK
jgi:hypothetical protein